MTIELERMKADRAFMAFLQRIRSILLQIHVLANPVDDLRRKSGVVIARAVLRCLVRRVTLEVEQRVVLRRVPYDEFLAIPFGCVQATYCQR